MVDCFLRSLISESDRCLMAIYTPFETISLSKRRSLDLLAIETFSFTPHLETSGEICINERLAGSSVGFVFIYVDNPDDDPCSPLLAPLGRHKRKKVDKLQWLLLPRG